MPQPEQIEAARDRVIDAAIAVCALSVDPPETNDPEQQEYDARYAALEAAVDALHTAREPDAWAILRQIVSDADGHDGGPSHLVLPDTIDLARSAVEWFDEVGGSVAEELNAGPVAWPDPASLFADEPAFTGEVPTPVVVLPPVGHHICPDCGSHAVAESSGGDAHYTSFVCGNTRENRMGVVTYMEECSGA